MSRQTAHVLSRRTLLADASPDSPKAEPPTEFRIFAFGAVETTKGDFAFTREAGEAVVAAWKAYGNALSIDYAHASIEADKAPDPAEAAKAAGWFGLELRDDGLWAVSVRWTDAAAAKLRAKEFRYFSPWIAFDEHGAVAELLNLALTNIPATKSQEALMPASQTGAAAPPTSTTETPALAAPPHSEPLDRRTAALSQKFSFDEIRTAICRALDKLYPPDENGMSLRPYICEVYDDAVVVEGDGGCTRHPYVIGEDGNATLGAGVAVKRAWVPVAETMPMGPPEPAEHPDMALARELLAITGKATLPEVLALAREKFAPPPPEPEMPEAAKAVLARADAEKTAALARAAEAEQKLAALQRADRKRAVLARVGELKALAGTALEPLADDLLALQDHDPKLAERIETSLRLASAAVGASPLLQPLSSQREGGEFDPVAETERRAEALCRATAGLSLADARTRAWQADPKLYAAHRAATSGAAAAKDDDE